MEAVNCLNILKQANRTNDIVCILPKSDFSKALINAVEKQVEKKPIFQFNLSDTVTRFECKCGNIIKVRHDIGIMDHNDAPNYCNNCGQKFDWSDER